MPSRALREWRTIQRAELDHVDTLLRGVRGAGAAERAVRRHVVDGEIVLLAGHFQRYCRGVYEEAVGFLAGEVLPAAAGSVVGKLLMEGRALTRRNATSETLRKDFLRLDLDLREALERRDQRNLDRMRRLNQLVTWRNAVAHQDEPSPGSAQLIRGTDRNVRSLRTWRHSCSALAHDIDAVVNQHMIVLAGRRAW